MMMQQVLQYLPEALLGLVAAFALLGIASAYSNRKRASFSLSTILLAAISIISGYMLASGANVLILGEVHVYAFSMLFVLLFSVTLALANALAYAYSKNYHELLMLIGFSYAGMCVVATASSILGVFLGIEVVAIVTSLMLLFEGRHRLEAAAKFFILSSIAAAMFAFGAALLLQYSPALALSGITTVWSDILGASMLLIAAALGFEAALFPFNLWVPDVYEGAPGHLTALISGINKKVAFAAIIEVYFTMFAIYGHQFSQIFIVLAVLTMFFGNILALVQDSVKRMFAYSSISQAGYILVGIAAASQLGLESSIFYMIAHAFMIIAAFALVLWLESKNMHTIEDYSSLGTKNAFAAAALSVIMLSMAGIPPLIGFTGKFLLFSSAIGSGLAWLAFIGIINSFLSIYYYARVMNSMYSGKPSARMLPMDRHVAAVVIFALAVIILFGIYPQPVISAASMAVRSLMI